MAKKIGSVSKVKADHMFKIYNEAVRLNGSAQSMRGFSKLRKFAEAECGIQVDDLVLRRIITAAHKDASTPAHQGHHDRTRPHFHNPAKTA